MCVTCGCGATLTDEKGPAGTGSHSHDHHHEHRHNQDGSIDFTPARNGNERLILLERDILSKNDALAMANRIKLHAADQFTLNVMSSPGAGKTTLLVRLIKDLNGHYPLAVIEGDQQTAHDAERIRAAGAPAIQINTGKGCHLDAHMVAHAIDDLPLQPGGLLLIENVGNLVCPAGFDLGEARRVVVLSVTEGDDKPLKYPDIFAHADLMILTKTDLLPHVDFDVEACTAYARRINPTIDVLSLSARKGMGMDEFYSWIDRQRAMSHHAEHIHATGR